MSNKTKNKKLLLLLIPAVFFLLCAIQAFLMYRDNRMSNFVDSFQIYIYPDTTAEQAFDMIVESGCVKSLKSLERAFKYKEVSSHIQPGHYTIDPSFTSVYLARTLNNGWESPIVLSLSGNLRIMSNISSKISRQLLLDSATVHQALTDEALLSEYGFRPDNVFSLLCPSSYEMYWTASMRDFLDKQKQRYDSFWTKENDALASALKLTRDQVCILASIVTSESSKEAEYPLIAGVYLNRLQIGMPLQADPTIAYCYDFSLNRILYQHLKVDSPYNTYTHKGLPPGPICVPNPASLNAVLHPDFGGARGKGNLYFCANADFSGTHVFAKSLSEHNANAKAFQKELRIRNNQKAD